MNMYPAYSCADLYPYPSNPMIYSPSNNSRAKETDPRTPNSPYQQPWPYGGSYWHPTPPEFHDCFRHNHFSGGPYGFWPPYPHYPPPPVPCYAAYPPFPGTYTIPPRYDYDKTTHTPHHCCGCTHHEDKKLGIQQNELNSDKKTSDMLVPKDYLYPVMWIPPGYMKKTESQDPVLLKPLEKTEPAQDQEVGDGCSQPFPLVWLLSDKKKAETDTKDNELPFFANDNKNESKSEPEMINKRAVQKVIPVKQIGSKEDMKDLKEKEGKPSPKTSKLPPVCLRIEPLPRKKNGLRSPSPPANKTRSSEPPTEYPKSSCQQAQSSEGLKKNEEKSNNVLGWETKANEVRTKKKLSEHEAALIIQSTYRGFEVRKSQPLTKLRQIAEVQKQVSELRNHVEDLESSFFSDKQKVIIGETIMGLLLKLDTIQGLHPMVRDVRKSVAKELVGLQEKLDSLTAVKSESSSEDHPNTDDAVEKCVEAEELKAELQTEEKEEEVLVAGSGGERQVVEENERLKEAVEELTKAGDEQLGVITELTGRVKELERKLAKKKKMKKKRKNRKGMAHVCAFEDDLS